MNSGEADDATATPDIPRVGLVGNGVVGGRLRRRADLLDSELSLRLLDTRRSDVASAPEFDGLAVVVLAQPGPHHAIARRLLQRRIPVITVGDRIDDVRAMLELDGVARRHGVPLVVGAGMSPGIVALLARHIAARFDEVDEIRVDVHGTAGPACARQHHAALAGTATTFHDGAEVTTRAGTGRLLAWFPEPVGAYDCYRAELPSPLIIRRAFPEVERVQARLSANRRDRLTARLPMLVRPHREGGVGAVRVEVRGMADGERVCCVAGIAEQVGTAAAACAGAFVDAVLAGDLDAGVVVPGAADLDTESLLRTVQRLGVRFQEFTGARHG